MRSAHEAAGAIIAKARSIQPRGAALPITRHRTCACGKQPLDGGDITALGGVGEFEVRSELRGLRVRVRPQRGKRCANESS